ncbi:hypothetical protein QOZ80_4AG0321390 [Eleusine coracana subsp. coracana]|nr:hypothetical protein QOZ80_4AG0321390 [Eleusine coracana subsp. coracana]
MFQQAGIQKQAGIRTAEAANGNKTDNAARKPSRQSPSQNSTRLPLLSLPFSRVAASGPSPSHPFPSPMAAAPTAPPTMRAVQYDAYGGGAAGLKHVEVPVPSPKKNELLLKLEAAAINPVDWKLQQGLLRPLLPRKFPFIPVTDVAGVVVAVGSGVTGFQAGDHVVAMLNSLYGGGLAEYAVASESLTVKRPPEVSAAEGAGLPVAAGTAFQALRAIGAKFDGTGKPLNVLITAASGGVGLYVVQLARLAGLHITATCGARNMELVRSLGADEVLDYRTPEGASLKSPSGKKYDYVIHCTVGISWSTFEPVLSESGKVMDLTPHFAQSSSRHCTGSHLPGSSWCRCSCLLTRQTLNSWSGCSGTAR